VGYGIWEVLQACGFKYQGGFRHEEMFEETFTHEDEVRKHLVCNGIPSIVFDHSSSQEEGVRVQGVEGETEIVDSATALQRWVAFANVPIKEYDAKALLSDMALPSDYQAMVWLEKLGFKIDKQTKHIYRPKSSTTEEGTESAADDDEVADEFSSIEQVRAFVRSASDETLLANTHDTVVQSPHKRARRVSVIKQDMPLNDDEYLALRVWAALSPTPLPVFDNADLDSSDEEVHPTNASPGSVCIIL